MLSYIISFVLLTGFMPAYFKIADRFNIIDRPNGRSSHSSVTIRGGGIVFPLAALLWFLLFGSVHVWLIGALLLAAVVSFLDDVGSLPPKVRIVAHFIAVTLLFWQLHVFGLPWYGVAVAYLFAIGWINAFNFMDGINGITPFYGFVALVTFGWLNRSVQFADQDLIIVLVFSVLLFSWFNARKQARTFAGDVGSVSLAFLLAWFMTALMVKTGRVEYILFFAVYGIDSAVTILCRLKRHENIFKAHRSHLYQYLSNELGWPHVRVAAIYALVQLAVNTVTLWLLSSGKMTWIAFGGFMALLSILYLFIRHRVVKHIEI